MDKGEGHIILKNTITDADVVGLMAEWAKAPLVVVVNPLE